MKKAETPSLTYSPRNAWDVYTTATQKRQMDALVKRYMDFLSNCKTERETVAYVQKRLQEAGFSEDFKKNTVFRNLRGKAIFAARKGKIPLQKGVHLIAAHADSPRLDFKQRPLVEQPGVAQAKTHYYGGIRKYQWLARPLALHGVVVLENGKSISVAIGEKAGEPVFTIADLLPHLARKQNSQTLAEVFDGEKLNIILGHSPAPTAAKNKDIKEPIKQHVLELLNAKYGIREEDLVTAELQVVPAGPATYVGFDKGLVGGYGQDDRICVFTALEALLNAKNTNRLCPNMAVMFWDKEISFRRCHLAGLPPVYCFQRPGPRLGPGHPCLAGAAQHPRPVRRRGRRLRPRLPRSARKAERRPAGPRPRLLQVLRLRRQIRCQRRRCRVLRLCARPVQRPQHPLAARRTGQGGRGRRRHRGPLPGRLRHAGHRLRPGPPLHAQPLRAGQLRGHPCHGRSL